MKYVCKNSDCPEYGKEVYLSSETFRFRNGNLVGEHAECPTCGKLREEINPNKDIPLSEKNISINLYDGMSMEQKREVLKKRSRQHYDKEIKERKTELLNKAVNEMRDLQKGKL